MSFSLGGDFIEPSFCDLSHSRRFIIASFFTPDYESDALKLRNSCRALALDFHLQCIASFGSWQQNIHFKPAFLIKMLDKYPQRSIAWVDADAIIRSYPQLFDDLEYFDCDIAAHHFRGKELLSGTLFVPNSSGARLLLREWAAFDAQRKQFKEQFTLDLFLKANRGRFNFYELPASYTQIFDLMRANGAPVIEHFQASRRWRQSHRMMRIPGAR